MQKKDQGFFSTVGNWFGNNVIKPVKKFGNAVYHSTSIEIGYGFGFGLEGKAAFINGSLMAVPVRNELIFADDCKTNSTTKFSANVDLGEVYGIGVQSKCSAYNGDGDGYSWMMPGHEWDYLSLIHISEPTRPY